MNDKSRYPGLRFVLTLAACLLPASAFAEYPFYFELDLEQQRIPLADGTRLDAGTFGFTYREYLSPGLGLDLRVGRLGVEHKQDGTALGYSPAGYYAGLGFTARTAAARPFQGGLDLRYSYYYSSETQNSDTLEVNWTQGEARLWGAFHIGGRFKLYGCAFALSINGDQTLKGTTPSQQTLDNRDTGGACAGLVLETADHGVIGIEGNGGARQGGRIYFGRDFR
jgi:hypothetical protein